MKKLSQAGLFIFAVFGALMAGSAAANATTVLYVASPGPAQTGSATFVAMPGLQLTLPAESTGQYQALVTLNVPNPYASGNNFPGGFFGIDVNGVVSVQVACFTSDVVNPGNTGRKPTTLVIRIPLKSVPQQITAVWKGVRSSTVKVDTPNALSAILY